MKAIQEMVDIMQAYQEGKQIQIYDKMHKQWVDDEPNWNWGLHEYRIKPKPEFVSFESAEEFLEAQREHGVKIKRIEDDVLLDIYVNYYTDRVLLVDSIGTIENTLLSILYRNYKFLDGTPCGKEVEE